MTQNPYFKSNKPPVPGRGIVTTPGGLVVPQGAAYDLEITVMFNTKNGNSELRMRSDTLKEFNLLQIAGILSEHATSLLRQLMSGQKIDAVPLTEEKKEGKANGST